MSEREGGLRKTAAGKGRGKDGASREGNVSIDRLKDKLLYYSAVHLEKVILHQRLSIDAKQNPQLCR